MVEKARPALSWCDCPFQEQSTRANNEFMEEIFRHPGMFFYHQANHSKEDLKGFIDSRTPQTGQTLLTQACWREMSMVARLLVTRGQADVEQPGQIHDGRKKQDLTALCCAADRGNLPLVKLLCTEGQANVQATAEDGTTALHRASRWNHVEVMEYLISKGAGLETTNKEGNTALTEACHHGRRQAAYLLVLKGANPNHPNLQGDTPLHLASRKGHQEVIILLLQAGVTRQPNQKGLTQLETAGWAGDPKSISLLYGSSEDTEEKIRACKLMTAKCILDSNLEHAQKWRRRYLDLMLPGQPEICIDPECPVIKTMHPLEQEGAIHTREQERIFWQQKGLLLLIEILGPGNDLAVEHLQNLESATQEKGQYQASLNLNRLIHQYDPIPTNTPHRLAEAAARLKDVATLLERMGNKGREIPWESYKKDTENLLQYAMQLWVRQEHQTSYGNHLWHQEAENATRMELEDVYQAALTAACLIISYEAGSTDQGTLQPVSRFIQSSMATYMGSGPLQLLTRRAGYKWNKYPEDRQKAIWLIEQFLRLGANVNHRNLQGATMMHTAMMVRPELSFVRPLLNLAHQYGMHLDVRDNAGHTVQECLSHPEYWNPFARQEEFRPISDQFRQPQPGRLECLAAAAASPTWRHLIRAKDLLPPSMHDLLEMHGPRTPKDTQELMLLERVQSEYACRK
jgi:ankyrin repeat protein